MNLNRELILDFEMMYIIFRHISSAKCGDY